MKHLSIQKTVDAYPGLSPEQRKNLLFNQNQKTIKTEDTIDSFPYEPGDVNPLERNFKEFKRDAILAVHMWELPTNHSMYPNDFIKATELKLQLQEFKISMLKEVMNL